jgi:hypothetical protein
LARRLNHQTRVLLELLLAFVSDLNLNQLELLFSAAWTSNQIQDIRLRIRQLKLSAGYGSSLNATLLHT